MQKKAELFENAEAAWFFLLLLTKSGTRGETGNFAKKKGGRIEPNATRM